MGSSHLMVLEEVLFLILKKRKNHEFNYGSMLKDANQCSASKYVCVRACVSVSLCVLGVFINNFFIKHTLVYNLSL